MHSASKLRLSSAPVLCSLEGDVGSCVVHHCEGAHPEVVSQPGHQPELDEAHYAGVVNDGGERNAHEGIHCCQADLHLQKASMNWTTSCITEHPPEFKQAHYASVVDNSGGHNAHKSPDCCQTDLDL